MFARDVKLSPAECSCNTPVWKCLVCLGKPWLAGSGVKLKACRTGQPWCRMFGHKCIPLYFTICFKFKKGVRVWSYWCCKCIHLNSLLCAGYVCGRMYEISGSSIQQLTNFFPLFFRCCTHHMCNLLLCTDNKKLVQKVACLIFLQYTKHSLCSHFEILLACAIFCPVFCFVFLQ